MSALQVDPLSVVRMAASILREARGVSGGAAEALRLALRAARADGATLGQLEQASGLSRERCRQLTKERER